MAIKLFTMCILKIANVLPGQKLWHCCRCMVFAENVQCLRLTRSQTWCRFSSIKTETTSCSFTFRVVVRERRKVVVVGCVFHALHVVLQFVNHDSDFEKTKMKLLNAANLVDKVQTRDALQRIKHTLNTHFGLIYLSAPAVLQAPKHQGGVDRLGGVDQPGLNQRHGQPSQHSGCIPVLEEQTAPQAAQRQRSAHHVSHPTLISLPDLIHISSLIPPLYLGMIATNICCPSGFCPAGSNCVGCVVSPGGGRFRAPPSAWHLSKLCALTTNQVVWTRWESQVLTNESTGVILSVAAPLVQVK